ncbi:MAG TPA: Gfo/Idh/MocA family oxidoreductase [Bacteroidales bacterium]|nr:Gfo/Idh/MocA family oxidoreductase [Bacteroidales bacterium]HPF02555.1 Gfo/Idh/MocA family oxidoreductase [Bacteroidales bacterium]HPJ60492.1 Gfo/Idh/MocA family oxidoreductase [Bacteroidales bacterium]HPR13268.1 Gfo/Idh/MocA family oxidoreductase [Bacteroidales bacterium]HRW84941.1 Gfo/Idh/MocA family oxidoreductase [Bacteroidales bacterium]
MKRRRFVKMTVAGSAALGSGPVILAGSGWKGANDRVNVAVIGIRAQGQSHIVEYNKLENTRVVAVCDVDTNLFRERIKKNFTDKSLPEPKTYVDLRKLYEDKDVDAVSIATPNHWHALASIWALQAGKHVSVEKPCCHNFFEGRKLVEAADKYKLIVQDGAEQRSNPCAISMAEYLHSGKLGEVYMAKGLCYKWRDTIGKTPDSPVPEGVNYDLWLGPAQKRLFSVNRFHYNWHWNWEYGNGDMGNQGVHEMDVARWGLNVTLPVKISAIGGHLMFDDDQNTPNTLMAVFEFPNPAGGGDKKKILQFEVRHWITNREGIKSDNPGKDEYMVSSDNVIGNLFYGSKGFMTKNVNEWQVYYGKERKEGEKGSGLGNHYKAFIEAIRANDRKLANADIRDGFYSCALMHLGNISYRLGRSLEFDPVRMKFVNAPDADALLTREYREPFVVRENI